MRPIKKNISEVPLIEGRGGKISVLISPKTAGSTQFILGVSSLEAGGEVNNHVHDYSYEAFYVVEGEGLISFAEFESIPFCQGDAVHVPKGVAHKIKNTGSEEMKVVFTASPLAPSPELGHREV